MTNDEMMKKHGILPPVDFSKIEPNSTKSEITTALHKASRALYSAGIMMSDSSDPETAQHGIEAVGASSIALNWIEHIKNEGNE